jgi:prepilin-type processing-associated H-X9-DG protein
MNSPAQSKSVSCRPERGIYSASTRDISRSRKFLRLCELLTFKRAKARAPRSAPHFQARKVRGASEASRSSVEIETCEKIRAPRGQPAFTLLELLVIVAALAMLSATLLPAFAKVRRTTAGTQCLDNKKQLTLAWLQYADDNAGNLCPNINVSTFPGPPSWIIESVENFVPDNTDNTNVLLLANAKLGPYCNRQFRLFKCPADIYTCIEGGQNLPRVRSISMNGYIEGGAYLTTGKGSLPPNEAVWYGGFTAYNKISDIVRPPPNNLFVFLDVHPDSISDGLFITDMADTTSSAWVDLPASYHNRACGFSFADGHAEIHKWLNPVTCQPVTKTQGNSWPTSIKSPDIAWMQQHSSVPYSQR